MLVSACGGLSGGSRSRPEPRPAEHAAPADPLSAPWVVRRSDGPIEQRLHVAATLESQLDSTKPSTADTLQSQLTASWSMASGNFPRRFIGSISDYRVSGAMGDSLRVPQGLALPFSFVAEQSTPREQPRFVSPDADACAPAASLVHGVRDLWLSLPDTLRAGMEWEDSTTYGVCRDSVLLSMEVRRTFRVTGALLRDSAVLVTVERRTATRLWGSGRQFGDSVTFSGEGTGTAMFEVSLISGAAAFASGESELRVVMRGSRRTQQLTQRSRISILDR
jgi:hypothetical protein